MYWGIDILLFLGVFILIFLRRTGYDVQRTATSLITAFLIVFIPKLLAVPFLFVEDLMRIFSSFPPRSLFLSEIVLFLAGAMLLVIFFGLTKGRYFYKVREEVLTFPDLPEI
ncbi:MAG TPA: phosphohydrolase, partial [Sphingobacterium sp.]|nr:phosphohydrolase [Sphingobacterium sp.]